MPFQITKLKKDFIKGFFFCYQLVTCVILAIISYYCNIFETKQFGRIHSNIIIKIPLSKPETAWCRNGDWKTRYSKLYSSRGISTSKKNELPRFSFMSNDTTPYAALLMKLRANQSDSTESNESLPPYIASLMSQRSVNLRTGRGSQLSDLGENETLLLDMVRSRSREAEDELRDEPLILSCEDNIDDQNLHDACVHVTNTRMTERSASRSRVSRMSTRRDMDIPSILAFTAATPDMVRVEIPAFQKAQTKREEIPRWSIRRSVCPVCSQKWKDKTSITNVRYSGIKRNSSYELPSVIAPARLRTLITMGYEPRPVPIAIDKESGVKHGSLRNTSKSWLLTRARRFRAPKTILSPEATAPPSCNAPTARKDLDLRVSRFLSD